MKQKTGLWYRICSATLWHIPRPVVTFDTFRLGLTIGTEIRLFTVLLARGDYR